MRFSRRRSPLARLLALTLAAVLGAFPALAQQGGDYQITQSVIPGGGGTSAGGDFTVDGTIGQSIVGSSSGGTYTIAGGFEPSPDSALTPTPTPTPLSTFVVTNTGNMGPGSLRQAITDANQSPGFDAVTFNIPGAGVQTIAPGSPLPAITDPVLIDGYTQPNASANTAAVGNNASILIQLQGVNAGAGASGLVITAGQSTVRGLSIYQFAGNAIKLQTNGGNRLEGCFLGLLAHGAMSGGSSGGSVVVESPHNQIGGTSPAARNVIVGGSGVPAIQVLTGNTGGNTIQGNYVGTNAAGTATLNNGHVLVQTSNNLIGGTATGAGNVIASNGEALEITGAGGGNPTGNTVQGNYIGLAADGAGALGNGGVAIYYSAGNLVGGTQTAARNVMRSLLIRYALSTNNVVQGNYIGTTSAGTAAAGSFAAQASVFIDGANNNTIGGTQPGAGNVISNGQCGVSIADASNCVVQGNLIGTNAAGTAAIPNSGHGVSIRNVFGTATGNLVGGTAAGARNVISGNFADGVNISSADGNTVRGNFIGVASDGTSPLGNRANGVQLSFANNNTVGGTANGAGNVIAYNGRPGMNDRGSGVQINNGAGNSVRSNSIYANGNQNFPSTDRGLALAFNVPPNDNCDGDAGANNLQNFPVITSALSSAAGTSVNGTLNSAGGGTYAIDFYANAACHGSGNGEGRTYLGSTMVTTDGSCNAAFGVTLPVSPPPGQTFITATATDAAGNTSEFSACAQASAPTPTPTPSPTPTPDCVGVSLPTDLTALNGSTLTVPVNVGDTTGRGIISFDFRVTYAASVLTPSATPYEQVGTLASGFQITVNSGTPGQLVVSGYGTAPLQGAGALLNLKFDVGGTAPACSALNLANFVFNEGSPCANTSGGQVCVANGAVSGSVTYGVVNGAVKPVPAVLLSAVGTPNVNASTNENGAYALNGLGGGPYTVTPGKTGDVNGVTSFDAALVAQHVVGLNALGANQRTAADASDNGAVTSFDAALIAQWVVGLPNQGVTGTWKFAPPSRSYQSTTAEQANQNYEAILVGEVSGNWTPTAGGNGPLLSAQTNDKPEASGMANAVFVKLPFQAGPAGGTTVIPVTVEGDLTGRGVVSYQFELTFDPNVLQPDVTAADTVGTLSAGLSVVANAGTPGLLKVAAFGAHPLGGTGTLLNLNFRVVGAPNSTTALAAQSFQLNEGDPPATSGSGQFTTGPSNGGTLLQFATAGLSVPEGAGQIQVSVTRSGDTAQPAAVDYGTSDGTASERRHYTTAAGRLFFGAGETTKTFSVLLTDDALAEGDRTVRVNLSNPSAGAQVVGPAAILLTIEDNDQNDSGANPVDSTEFFVRQHYHDFFSREPDAEGLAFWVGNIEQCGADSQCRDARRVDTSAAFFLSIEFQESSYLAYRIHRATFNRLPLYRGFLRDTQELVRGVVVGRAGWEQRLEQNKQAFARDWVERPEVLAELPTGMTAAQFVDKLFANAGGTPTTAERDAALAAFGAGGTEGRAAALRSVVESGSVYNRQYNPAFVLMQYIGYLRRNPNDSPDTDFAGYNFWLAKIDSFSLPDEDVRDPATAQRRVQRAEMVRAFIISNEYRKRFGR